MRFFGVGSDFLSSLPLSVPRSIQRRLVNYALRRALGPLVKRNISAEDLELQLRDGRLSLSNLDLKVESINEHIASYGITLTQGSIELLEITIPWSEILSGKISVLVSGMKVTIAPLEACRKDEPPGGDLGKISGSVTDIAESFVDDDLKEQMGVGTEDIPEPAMLQRLLETIMANLEVEITRLEILLEAPKIEHHLSITASNVIYGNGPSTSNKSLEASGLQVKVINAGQKVNRAKSSMPQKSQSASSRSTSSSSFDDAELMQSTIFGAQEGRSLYMSAMSSPSIYHSVIAEESQIHDHGVESNPRGTDNLVFSCSRGFTALMIPIDASTMQIDISSQEVDILAGQPQILCLCALLSQYGLPSGESNRSDNSLTSVKVYLRLSAITCGLDLTRDNDLDTKSQPADGLAYLSFSLKHINLFSSSGALKLKVQEADFKVGNNSVFSEFDDPERFLEFQWQSHRSANVEFRPLALQIDLATLLDVKRSTQQLLKAISKEMTSTHQPVTEQSKADNEFSAQVRCSSLRMRCNVQDHPVAISLGPVVASWSTTSKRHRVSIEFRSLLGTICDEIVLRDDVKDIHIVDITTTFEKPLRRTLEFIKYEELFEHSERDHKSALSTLQAVKQRAKDSSSKVFRASLGSLTVYLDRRKLMTLIKASQSAQYIYNLHSANDLKDCYSATEKSSDQVVTYLGEVKDCKILLDAGKHQFSVRATGCSIFVATNLKNIDVASVDFLKFAIVAVNEQETPTSIISQGIHLNGNTTDRVCPMISIRGRRNRAGLRPGSFMIRTGLTDIHTEYHVEMLWIDTLAVFLEQLKAGKQEQSEVVYSPLPCITLAIDLFNVSLGLNPYTTAAKGLVYFRNSAIRLSPFQTLHNKHIKVHAGVIDSFLIDDIEGAQNDLSDSKRTRRDHVASALLKLGFVQVASVETVEIEINLEQQPSDISCSVELSGAIFTITTCPDSTATLLALVNALRLPIILSDDLKYNLGMISEAETSLDVFGDVEEDAFRSVQDILQSSAGKMPLKPTVGPEAPKAPNSGDVLAGYEACSRKGSLSVDPNETFLVIDDEKDETTLALVDEHFLSASVLEFEQKRSSRDGRLPRPLIKIRARNCFAVWNLHDGYDWDKTRQEIVRAVDMAVAKAHKRVSKQKECSKTSEAEVDEVDDNSASTDSNEISDLLFNYIYISLPSGTRSEDVTKSINQELAQASMSDTNSQTTATADHKFVDTTGDHEQSLRLGRSKVHKVRIDMSGICASFEIQAAGASEVLNHLDLTVKDFEIIDNISTSTWRKFLTYHRGAGSREMDSNMADISLTTVKSIAGLAAAELIIKGAISPLRLHVDQDTLEFLTRFFEFRDGEASPPTLNADEIFIQRFELQAIVVQIDYKPKRVDYKSLRSGRTTEFKNFFILEDSNMVLKHVILYGICGFARVFQYLNDIWLAHIKSDQLGSVLAGISPLRSIASFGGGLKSLVTIPIAEYHKDGRFVPGLKKGLSAFARSTGSEAVRLGAKLAIGTQGFLESAESIMNQTSETSRHGSTTHAVSLYANQPRDLRQGVSQAISGMTRNVVTARDALSTLPRDLEEERDARGAVLLAARSVPTAVIRPLIGTTEMISKTLLGLRNTLHPEQRKMNDDKYK